MTREDAINYLYSSGFSEDQVKTIAKAFEPIPKNDCISRDEVCRYVAEFVNHEFSTREEEELIDNIITGIEHLPSVTPQEPKTGHWIRISPAEIYECSECGQNIMTSDICAYKFCHGCGAKMVEPQESEDT